MKYLIFFLSFSHALLASANEAPKVCAANAEKFAQKILINENYDQDGIVATGCSLATNKKVVICEVAAMKGDGAASDTYLLVLNSLCTRVLRYELYGEE